MEKPEKRFSIESNTDETLGKSLMFFVMSVPTHPCCEANTEGGKSSRCGGNRNIARRDSQTLERKTSVY